MIYGFGTYLLGFSPLTGYDYILITLTIYVTGPEEYHCR